MSIEAVLCALEAGAPAVVLGGFKWAGRWYRPGEVLDIDAKRYRDVLAVLVGYGYLTAGEFEKGTAEDEKQERVY